jgi:peptidoglycan/xylan/chitin deacetylase (PgdA/CDA1 family)
VPTKIGIIFDDGFIKSTLATAKLFEEFKLPAVFAVIADPTNFVKGCGDFVLWNEMQSRGHIVQPHGYMHTNLSKIPHEQAVVEIDQCLATFGENLQGFDASECLYAFAYNSGPPALCEYLLPRVRAVRIGGEPMLSERQLKSRVWKSETFGPGDPADDFLARLEKCRRKKPAALFYCLHGIDGEYWGAIALDKLRRILDMIVTDEAFEYWDLGDP